MSSTTQTPQSPSPSPWTTTAALSGFTAIALGAFGAHGLQKLNLPPSKISSWTTAAHYQLVHAVALLVIDNSPALKGNIWTKRFFVAGMLGFSGSIYALVLWPSQMGRVLGPVTPLGGLGFLMGWGLLGLGSLGWL